MSRWSFVIDVAKCWDCNNCLISCKDEHEGNDWPGYTEPQPRHGHRWIDLLRTERGQYPLIDVAYRPTPCMHCRNAPCVKVSGGAISRRADGIVLVDPDKARGRSDLVAACPYGALFWNAERNVLQKCTFCAHLLDAGWQQPRCAQSCFTGALRAVRWEEPERAAEVEREGLETLHPEYGTDPSVLYKNLYRIEKVFIAGSAATKAGERLDCAQGARVRLFRGADPIAETTTDVFGDFKFDRLPADSGAYALELEHEGRRAPRVELELRKSVNLGVVMV